MWNVWVTDPPLNGWTHSPVQVSPRHNKLIAHVHIFSQQMFCGGSPSPPLDGSCMNKSFDRSIGHFNSLHTRPMQICIAICGILMLKNNRAAAAQETAQSLTRESHNLYCQDPQLSQFFFLIKGAALLVDFLCVWTLGCEFMGDGAIGKPQNMWRTMKSVSLLGGKQAICH